MCIKVTGVQAHFNIVQQLYLVPVMDLQSPSTMLLETAVTKAGQAWDAGKYAEHGRFNYDVAGPALEMLDPQPGI